MADTTTTNRLATFFKGSDTEFGIFYPKNHLLAVYPSMVEADRAKEQLSRADFRGGDLIAVSGDEVVQFAENHLLKDGLWGMLMTSLSRLIGTEALYADKDLAAAKKGAAFVAVHCPTEQAEAAAWKVLEPTHPLVARYYSAGGINHLAGESKV